MRGLLTIIPYTMVHRDIVIVQLSHSMFKILKEITLVIIIFIPYIKSIS
jgi:hypothetical protein